MISDHLKQEYLGVWGGRLTTSPANNGISPCSGSFDPAGRVAKGTPRPIKSAAIAALLHTGKILESDQDAVDCVLICR